MLKSLIIREIQVKTIRYYLTPVRMAIIKKKINSKCWNRCGKKVNTVDETVNCSYYGNQYGDSFKKTYE